MENFDDKYRKKNPFTVPDGYFEELTGRIMKNVDRKKMEVRPKGGRIVRFCSGLAAVLVLSLIVTRVLYTVIAGADKGAGEVVREEVSEEVFLIPEETEEDIFDSYFNPTGDEIIEYLATEADNYDLMYAGIY